MTVNLCIVSGTLVAPDGSPMPEVEVRFLPAPVAVREQGDDTLVPRPVAAVTDAAAGLSLGLAPGVYTVRTRDAEGREYPPFLVDVPPVAAVDLSEIILHLPALQSVYDAAASARVASKAAAAALEAAAGIGTGGSGDGSGGGGPVAWTEVTGKPVNFPPAAHSHALSEITDFPTLAPVATSGAYGDLAGRPTLGTAAAAEAAAFAPVVHGHAIAEVAGLSAALDGKAATAAFSDVAAGLVPAAGAGAADRFLRADGQFAELLDGGGLGPVYATRAAFEAAVLPDAVTSWSVRHGGCLLQYVREAAGTAIESANGVKGAPAGVVRPEHWGATGDGMADDAPAIQAALDHVQAQGGGDVLLRARVYRTGATLRVRERVTLAGVQGAPRNWWEPSGFTFAPGGTVLRAADGLHADVVVAELSGGEANNDRRHGGGLRRLNVDGNKTHNTSGNGVVLNGVNVFTLRDVIVGRCAERGVWAKSSGGGDSQCNNLHIDRTIAFDNAASGFSLSGGDSQVTGLWSIANGLTGLTAAMGATIFSNCYFNDNGTDGVYSSGEDCDFVGVTAYHNRRNGMVIASKRAALVGCKARHNGMNQAFAPTDRCGIVIASTAEGWLVDGCSAYDEGYRGDPADLTQRYGFRITSTSPGVWGDNQAFGNLTTDFSFADPAGLGIHPGMPASAPHPGFVATGSIDFNTHAARRIRGLSFDAPLTVTSVAGNVLNLSSHSTITLNVAGGATINAISGGMTGLGVVFIRNIGSAPVTFTSNSQLRTRSGSGLVLPQNAAATFKEFAPGVWFEVAGSEDRTPFLFDAGGDTAAPRPGVAPGRIVEWLNVTGEPTHALPGDRWFEAD